VIRPSLAGLLWAAGLVLCACGAGPAEPARSPAAEPQPEPTPAVQARTEQLQDAGFVVIQTSCGLEVALQVGTRSIRARIPIVGFSTPQDDAALWQAPEVTVELFSLQADMIGAAALAGAALLEPFRQRELNLSAEEAPGLDATALSLPPPPANDPQLALDQWQLVRRERAEPHRVEDAHRVYVVASLGDVVVALLTHTTSGMTASADTIRQTFAQSLRVEDEVPDLAALGGIFAERDARDPKCKEDPLLIVADSAR
jgi:hypothetical protein